MLTAFLHRRRKLAQQALAEARAAGESSVEAVALVQKAYGIRLLVRGFLWVSIYLLSRGLLELPVQPDAARVAIALLPAPFFAWYLWTWMKGIAAMDELERRIELEALGFAFPAAVLMLMTMGLLDLAIALPPDDFGLRHIWLMMPVLYYAGLWRARRRYQ